MQKVLLWNPTPELENQVSQLDCIIIGKITEDSADVEQEIRDKCKYDAILIPYENFVATKKHLKEIYKIDNVYTYYEYKVLNEKEYVQENYHNFYDIFAYSNCKTYFYNKNVVIIGGGSGIGYACAEAFLRLGARVVIGSRNLERVVAAKKELSVFGKIECMQWSVDCIRDNSGKIAEAEKLMGGNIDILVNSAGKVANGSFFEMKESDFDSVFDTNIKGMYFLCQDMAQYWIEKKQEGNIVNVLSIGGFKPTVTPYGMSKWAGRGLTIGLGQMLAEYGITVNGVAPAEVATEFIGYKDGVTLARRYSKTGRITLPEEVASIVLYLSSFMGKQMPGKIIEIDGGDDTIKLF